MRHAIVAVLAALSFLFGGLVQAQTPAAPQPAPSPAAFAAAHELVQAAGAADNFKAALPIIMESLKKAVVQNRPEMEKKYDELMPLFNQAAARRMNELIDSIALVYANNFNLDELHDLTAFYHSPTGQKFRARMPQILQQSMTAGQQLGRSIAEDIQRISGPL